MPAHSADLRKGRMSAIGQAYVITSICSQRQPFLSDLYAARCVVNGFKSCDELGLSQTLAFVVMPDHFHWLLILQKEGLDSLVRRLKSSTAIELNRNAGTVGRTVWQTSFHDHAVRYDEDVQAIARYIVANPVRAGLVQKVGSYSYWDACWL
ncbi:REP-associated tyrosine transposase [Deefgea rivuli]|uniref:REP-associated tyrosine transposase n=1 Tax=Deefgea rivuli TaxID=400948 RepID=UPI000487833F|nr:transposase [Deefgea rivuli]